MIHCFCKKGLIKQNHHQHPKAVLQQNQQRIFNDEKRVTEEDPFLTFLS